MIEIIIDASEMSETETSLEFYKNVISPLCFVPTNWDESILLMEVKEQSTCLAKVLSRLGKKVFEEQKRENRIKWE